MHNLADLEDKNVFIVSNRVPVSVKVLENGTHDFRISSGGLVGALRGLSRSMNFKWYGWPGQELTDTAQQSVKDELAKYKAVPVFLEKELAEKHYNGFSSRLAIALVDIKGADPGSR
jgi:trehalose 6-phosphate synthase